MDRYVKEANEFRVLVTSLGYDIKLSGCEFFEELVYEVRQLLREGKTDEEIEKIMPVLITEYGSCFHEIGRNNYIKGLNEFFEKRRTLDFDQKTDKEVNIIIPSMSLTLKVLTFSKYLNDQEIVTNDEPKKLIRKNNSSSN